MFVFCRRALGDETRRQPMRSRRGRAVTLYLVVLGGFFGGGGTAGAIGFRECLLVLLQSLVTVVIPKELVFPSR